MYLCATGTVAARTCPSQLLVLVALVLSDPGVLAAQAKKQYLFFNYKKAYTKKQKIKLVMRFACSTLHALYIETSTVYASINQQGLIDHISLILIDTSLV